MKTTENISLAGYAFTIETDAYAELGKYLDDIKEAFDSDPSAEEITADIEARIAELLREKCISGMVVDMKMIQDIKRRIGNPKMLAQEDVETVENPQTVDEKKQNHNNWKNKRLFLSSPFSVRQSLRQAWQSRDICMQESRIRSTGRHLCRGSR